ncbi:hypothetical protein CJP74_00240 [Psittacicella melopsittaci]|uniref:Uncharacterized protein n=1 Tax=Psittacicella melopsittaci TaxID=2028576 RepID=A0A3A1Y6Y6_9GAMM|nr:hypothetical protein [Psittacicella melopsittaci]RIY34043.1 hypothetical protein CJP74_00240 [Psittacicella melopsittaci]
MYKSIFSLALGVVLLAPAYSKTTLTNNDLKRFNQIYQTYGKQWLAGYRELLTKNISPGTGARPVVNSRTMVNEVVISFYRTINANKRPQLKQSKYTFPAFNDFTFAQQVCRIAQKSPAQMTKLEKSNFVAKKFCEYTTFYYGLFVADFKSEQVNSLNALASRKFFTQQQWQSLTRGRYGFSYRPLKTSDLHSTRLGKYVIALK